MKFKKFIDSKSKVTIDQFVIKLENGRSPVFLFLHFVTKVPLIFCTAPNVIKILKLIAHIAKNTTHAVINALLYLK